MKISFLLLFFITTATALACQQSRYKPMARQNIDDANRLGIDEELSREIFALPISGFSGVMLEMPKGASLKSGDGDSIYVAPYYIDATEVCNAHYRAFVEWNARVFESLPQVVQNMMPDTAIWLRLFPNEEIGELLQKQYFRNPAFDYYPVVGISWQQAQAYAFWRSDRINEAILIDGEKLFADTESQLGEYHFSTINYLQGLYEGTPGRKPMRSPITGEERRVRATDNILLPYYRLPTAAELEYAAAQPQQFEKNKEFAAFKKKITAHNKQYRLPAYYDHNRYNLPRPIIEETASNAPHHLNSNVDEWTQQNYRTSEQYNMHYARFDEKGNLSAIHVPIWYRQAIGLMDTSIVNNLHQQHSIKNSSPYKGFRCVMPNMW